MNASCQGFLRLVDVGSGSYNLLTKLLGGFENDQLVTLMALYSDFCEEKSLIFVITSHGRSEIRKR